MQQFIEDLADILPTQIKKCFYKEHDFSEEDEDALVQYIHFLMDKYLNGYMNRSELSPCIKKVRKSRQRKKEYWYGSLCEKLSLPIENSNNPARHEYAYAQTLSDEELSEKYGITSNSLSLSDCIINSCHKKLDIWKTSPDFLFCAFPFFRSLPIRSRSLGLDLDIINIICDYIKKELNGDINYYSHSYPEELLHYPVFSVGSCFMDFQEDAALEEPFHLSSAIPESDNYSILKYIVPMNSSYKMQTSLDAVDFSILNSLISLMGSAIYSGPVSIIPRVALSSAVFGSHRSSVQMERLDNRLNKLAAANMLLRSEETSDWSRFSFFDHITFEEKTASYICELAPSFHRMLLTKKLIPVTNPNYCRLKKKFSKYLLFTIQKERIACYLKQIAEKSYSYSFFTRFILFPESNIRKNMNLIQESLSEMAVSNVGISSFERKSDAFLIHFLPLTTAEIHDLNLDTIHQNTTIN